MDLCLECRACKAECPVGVDVARFKSEFLADYYARHGIPMRAKLLGNAQSAAVWGSRFAPVANRLAANPALRWVGEKLFDIDSRRALPLWRRDTLAKQTSRRQRASGRPVTLFNDTFTNHYEPEIGTAAAEILERGGCSVDVVRPGCCGRPLISQGLLREARTHAERLIDGLHPIAARGESILFLEPSCLSAVKDDAGRPAARRPPTRKPAKSPPPAAFSTNTQPTSTFHCASTPAKSCSTGTAIRNPSAF